MPDVYSNTVSVASASSRVAPAFELRPFGEDQYELNLEKNDGLGGVIDVLGSNVSSGNLFVFYSASQATTDDCQVAPMSDGVSINLHKADPDSMRHAIQFLSAALNAARAIRRSSVLPD